MCIGLLHWCLQRYRTPRHNQPQNHQPNLQASLLDVLHLVNLLMVAYPPGIPHPENPLGNQQCILQLSIEIPVLVSPLVNLVVFPPFSPRDNQHVDQQLYC